MNYIGYLTAEIDQRNLQLASHKENGEQDMVYIQERVIDLFSKELSQVQATDADFLEREEAGRAAASEQSLASRYYYSQS